jgi:hypothetical protein
MASQPDPTPEALTGTLGGEYVSGGVQMTSFIIAGTVGMVIGFNIGFFAYVVLEIGKS